MPTKRENEILKNALEIIKKKRKRKMKKLSKKKMDELIEKAVKWTMSPERKLKIKEAMESKRERQQRNTRETNV